MFRSSLFLNVVYKRDKELNGDGFLERSTIRADDFCSDDSTGHNAEIVKSLPGNTYSSGDDLEKKGYSTNDTCYKQHEGGSSSELINNLMNLCHFS